ncbi:phosphate ABC transporter substrate-binding protein PstS [Diaphorobacter aerolatus]|uniref:Phosphate-binding protein PstS n=1 Tax=Diaphorobacter aerolatus TaxID=1288495 RepID=A0A7H0GI08_9BURK|nr:phosphate ABC transporter substrate-binding protein PstS [Diaphorobacter aerolatus]
MGANVAQQVSRCRCQWRRRHVSGADLSALGRGLCCGDRRACQLPTLGLGDGVAKVRARSVDFGATDNPLTAQALAADRLIQVPTVVGALVPVVNLPGVAAGALRLNAATLSAIFLGEIQNWSDTRIAALNPGLKLPSLSIARVVRRDASGSTETFIRYLVESDVRWKAQIGKTAQWTGAVISVNGTDEVVSNLLAQPGSVGYVSYDRVQSQRLNAVTLQNRDGQWVTVSEESILAAVRGADLRANLRNPILNAPGARTWPLSELTYVLVAANPKESQQGTATVQFLYWALKKGDVIVRNTGFVALPPIVQAAAFKELMSVRAADGRMIELSL